MSHPDVRFPFPPSPFSFRSPSHLQAPPNLPSATTDLNEKLSRQDHQASISLRPERMHALREGRITIEIKIPLDARQQSIEPYDTRTKSEYSKLTSYKSAVTAPFGRRAAQTPHSTA